MYTSGMEDANRLGLRVAGVTALVFTVLAGLYFGGRTLLQRGDTTPSPLSETQRSRDRDGDGVADLYETNFYNTDPDKADTDGDGTSDLDEIIAGTDPTRAGPGDEQKPATGSAVTQQDTYTQLYLATLPDDIPRDQILDQARITAFVEQNKGELLPPLAEGRHKTTEAEGAEAIEAYLDSISSVHNPAIRPVTSSDLEAAFRLQVNGQDTGPMDGVVENLTGNVAILEEVAAPAEASQLHRTLLTASVELHKNAVALRNVNQDFIGGLIAARKIEELGAVFNQIASEIQALEIKYGLE